MISSSTVRVVAASEAALTGAGGKTPIVLLLRLPLPPSLAGRCTATERKESGRGMQNEKGYLGNSRKIERDLCRGCVNEA